MKPSEAPAMTTMARMLNVPQIVVRYKGPWKMSAIA
jgi:hypothetical protein